MDEERIALEFLSVYKKYKEKSFRRRVEKGGMQRERKDSGKRSRLNKINK